MEKFDARKLKPEVQQQLRNQAARLFKKGWKNQKIAEALGVSHVSVSRWRSAYTQHGSKGLKLGKRGRRMGALRTLSFDQEKEIQKIIMDKYPDQLKLPFALWTRKAVQQFVFELWSIKMPIRTVGEYLMRWKFTPQKPLKRAYEQNPKAVKQWLEEDYPDIAASAKTQKAEIHWGDETGLANNCQHGRSYSLRGKTPVLRLPAKKERINLISSVTNQGLARFMIYDGNMNSATFIKFMKRLIKDAGRKIYLILDNLRVHHSKPVKKWVKDHINQIELFFLPSYSPELNPDEYLNCDLKDGVHSKVPSRFKKDLKKKALSHLRKIQKSPKRVKSYFKHPKIAYAA
ncbi:IS630 family transposase [bacterium]|nr:IS630 family transposase [bacterium]